MDIRTIEVGGYNLRVATSQGSPGSIPLFVFNGLGANLELVRGFADEMGKYGTGIVVFDVPGVGGSSPPAVPYRLWCLSGLANEVLLRLGITGQVDVVGVSWGGGLAQEYAHCYPRRVRRLVLAATSAGAFAVPGHWSALLKMISPHRYDRGYMRGVCGELYGGKFRDDPGLVDHYGKLLWPPHGLGYYFQVFSAIGWTSIHWLFLLRQPTLVMMGTDDPIMPVVNGRLLAALIPNARLVTIPDGHLFLMTSARECAPIIRDFLAEREWSPAATVVGAAR